MKPKPTNNTRITPESQSFAITADCAIFGYAENALRVLLVRRAVEPFGGYWCLPGGAIPDDETLEETAAYLLRELVGVSGISIHPVRAYSDPDRHPIRRVVTVSFFALVRPEDHVPKASQYFDDARWCRLDDLPELGFDHPLMLADALRALQRELSNSPLAFRLLPDPFTLRDVQEVYEAVLGEKQDRRNFRRKVLAYDFLVPTGEKKSGVKGGPELYRIDRKKLAAHLEY